MDMNSLMMIQEVRLYSSLKLKFKKKTVPRRPQLKEKMTSVRSALVLSVQRSYRHRSLKNMSENTSQSLEP